MGTPPLVADSAWRHRLDRRTRSRSLAINDSRSRAVTPHERRVRELEAMRGLVADLDGFVQSSNVGTVPAIDVAAAFERHTARLPADSKILVQFQGVAARLRQGPTRTRVEGIRQISRKLRIKADEFAHIVEARDAKLRPKG
jgi:hypothetical protein